MNERNFYLNFLPEPPLTLPLGVASFVGPFLRFKPLLVALCASYKKRNGKDFTLFEKKNLNYEYVRLF